MKIEMLVLIENQKFFVDPEVHHLWIEYQSQPAPDEGAWAARLKGSLNKDLFNEFVSLLLAQAAEAERHRAAYARAIRRNRRR